MNKRIADSKKMIASKKHPIPFSSMVALLAFGLLYIFLNRCQHEKC